MTGAQHPVRQNVGRGQRCPWPRVLLHVCSSEPLGRDGATGAQKDKQKSLLWKVNPTTTNPTLLHGQQEQGFGTTLLKGWLFPKSLMAVQLRVAHRVKNNDSTKKHVAFAFFTSGIPNTDQNAAIQDHSYHYKKLQLQLSHN